MNLSALSLPPLATLRVSLRAVEPVHLPGWLGSMLHGALGHAIERLDPRDASLLLSPGTPPPASAADRWMAASPPSPISIVPPRPASERTLHPGQILSFGVIVMGPALDAGLAIVDALVLMAAGGLGSGRGRCELSDVADQQGPLIHDGMLSERAALSLDAAGAHGADAAALEVRAVTPLQIQSQGQRVQAPSWEQLVEAAVRRVLILQSWFGASAPSIDFEQLAARAGSDCRRASTQWERFRVARWSERQQQRHQMVAVLGGASAEGELGPWARVLEEAARVGIGKGTALGFGHIAVRRVGQGA